MKVTFFDIAKEEEPLFAQFLGSAETSFFEENIDEKNIKKVADSEVISVFVNSEVNKIVIDALPNLKLIATRSTGYDHIDIEYCKSKGIAVATVPGYGSHTVAEFAFALLLALSRKVLAANHNLKESDDFSIFGLQGFDLNGKTIGVLGTGRIGKNVIRIAKGFGMSVVAYDLCPDVDFAKEVGFEYETLEGVLAQADVLTLHAPCTKESHHLINRENIALMKKGVYLINTARGDLVDTDALIWGLKEGIIGAAGLDVLEGERELREEIEILASKDKSERIKDYKTLLEDRALIDLPNVIVTPHIAFYSREAEAEIIKITEENIKNFISGSPQNLVK